MQGLDELKLVFQDDNDPQHSANHVVDWLFVQKFNLIWHPPQSYDLGQIINFEMK